MRDFKNRFEMPEGEFKNQFRLSQALVITLVNILEPHMNQPRRQTAIPNYLKILCTLNFLGHGSFQRCVGTSLWTSMSQSSISRAVSEITQLITRLLMPEWIKFPTTLGEKNIVKEGFYEKYGLRGVIGAIDGTHVNIMASPSTDEDHPPHVYIDRLRQYSINVMLVCDSNCRILACDARFPGSVHDSGDNVSHLIGDSGYGLEPWLFTPYTVVVEGTPQAQFNILLRSGRNVIERTNGVLKGRFRCLSKHRQLLYHPAKAAIIIYTGAILHNIALWANEELDERDILVELLDDNDPIDHAALNLGRAPKDNYEYVRANIG
jgi:hypothetical protein